MQENKAKIHYLCDGEKKDCKKRNCYKTIGDCEDVCKYTQDIRNAKNFYKKIPQVEWSGFWEKNRDEEQKDIQNSMKDITKRMRWYYVKKKYKLKVVFYKIGLF